MAATLTGALVMPTGCAWSRTRWRICAAQANGALAPILMRLRHDRRRGTATGFPIAPPTSALIRLAKPFRAC
jgi:hypothetical protein